MTTTKELLLKYLQENNYPYIEEIKHFEIVNCVIRATPEFVYGIVENEVIYIDILDYLTWMYNDLNDRIHYSSKNSYEA